jgi:hypothetical protein
MSGPKHCTSDERYGGRSGRGEGMDGWTTNERPQKKNGDERKRQKMKRTKDEESR